MYGYAHPLTWLRHLGHLLPSRCLLCEIGLLRHEGLLCTACLEALPRNPTYCAQCALPLATQGLCPDCLSRPPCFSKAIAPFQYLPPLAGLINQWKHAGDCRPLSLWLNLLEEAVLNSYQQAPLPELLVPVPLHWRRRLVRGFNQTEQMAHYLSKRLAIPVQHQLLKASAASHSQQGLNRRERQKNLANRFCLAATPPAQHLALIDDVMTTGATASHLAQLLMKAGATRVDLWLIARTP